MAREQITHNRITPPPAVAPDEPGATREQAPPAIVYREEPRRNVHVQWDRGFEPGHGWLQLGIDVSVRELRGMLEDAEREAQAAARAQEHIGEYDTEEHTFRVYSDVLTRVEANRAISTLRRARDVAHGKDA